MSCSVTRLARLRGQVSHRLREHTHKTVLCATTCLMVLATAPMHAWANSAPLPSATEATVATATTATRAAASTTTGARTSALVLSPRSIPIPINKPEAVVMPVQDPLAELYEHAARPLLWSAFGNPREVAFEAIEALAAAHQHGLDPERYATATLYKLIAELNTDRQIDAFDKLLTAAVWTLNEDLRRGAEPAPLRDGTHPPVADEVISELADAIAQGSLNAHLESHIPQFASYQELQQALETYREYRLMDGWTALPADTRLIPGEEHPSIPALRQRLALTDGLAEDAQTSDQFDPPLKAAIMRFQQRHHLQVDGHVGPATLAKLNVSVDEKLRWLRLNLARLRTLPPQLPADRLQVNIPEFQLRLYTDSTEALTMGVVVGNKRNPTPSMQDRLRHLVFNPYWYPTRRITVNEILPRLKRDPDYLERSRFEMIERKSKKVVDSSSINWETVVPRTFPYRFRQIPGEKNSLGQVKFIFPNTQSIYLHDTPSRDLFGERVRAFSHGCVRVEKPTELATHLMAWDRGWTETDVLAEIDAAKRKLRKFKRKMDIYLLYQTVAVRQDGVNFYPDIYRRDRAPRVLTPLAPMVATFMPGTPSSTPDRRALATR